MADLRTATPDLGAIVPVGGWPMFAPEGYKAFVNKNKKDIDAGKFTLVVVEVCTSTPVSIYSLKLPCFTLT